MCLGTANHAIHFSTRDYTVHRQERTVHVTQSTDHTNAHLKWQQQDPFLSFNKVATLDVSHPPRGGTQFKTENGKLKDHLILRDVVIGFQPANRKTTTCPAAGEISSTLEVPRRRAYPTASSSTIKAIPVRKATRFFAVNGCTKLSKHNKRCWRHGGSIKCKVADCDNRAKSKGVCWSHGGGTLCSFETCDTISVSKGFCWAHGGGKRCLVPDCFKPAYERTRNYCVKHFKALRAGLDTAGGYASTESEVKISSVEIECKVEWGL